MINRLLPVILGLALAGAALAADPVKIGFIVKQPEEPWFQNEWKFAQMAAEKDGFKLIRIGGTDGEKVMSAIDNLGAQGAQGFIVCAPDTRLGSAVQLRAKANGLKVMSVDDRLIGADNQPIAAIPHMGISATEIGRLVGRTLADEIKKRGFKTEETAALRISFDGLETARERTQGAVAALTEAGFRPENIFSAPQKTTDTEGGLNAALPVLNKNAGFKHWVIFALNDESVLGGVRAAENLKIPAADLIGVGIGGSQSAKVEFAKTTATGFAATVLISPKRHGFDAADLMYRWITAGQAPPAVTLTSGILVTRDTIAQITHEQGLD